VPATIPAIHVLHLLPLLSRWNVDPAAFAAEFELHEAALAEPGARISIQQAARVLRRAHELTGERNLGYFFGLQMRASAHGFLGFAAMTAPTLRSALELVERFAPTLTDALSMRLSYAGERAMLRIEELVPLGDAREVIITALVVGIWQMASGLTAMPLAGETELTFEEPPEYRARFLHLTPQPIRFGAAHNQLTVERKALDTRLVMADPAAQRLAIEQCDRELLALTKDRATKDVVRALISEPGGLALSLVDVARRVHLSERTLKRRLMEQGTSFVELLDGARRERAVSLLQTTELGLADVAEQVGYTELSNFTRAFRRWTGVTPNRFRKALR
jgi:AraC-like DNA-binding protein